MIVTRRFRVLALSAALATTALSAQPAAQSERREVRLPDETCVTAPASDAEGSESPPVLVEGLGHAGIDADSDDEEARAWFAQGVRLVWAFDEAEAVRAFRQAQRLDPNCALCFFGEAWARSPTINLNPRTDQLEPARTAARRAAALADRLGERDRLLVQAMALRTADGEAFDQTRYAAFLETAALRLPDDATIAILAADARMQVSESMEPGSLSQRLLERVLAREPDHGGAIHFYIHLTDWIDRQHLAVPYADRLGRIAPAASHLIHMPSHSYYGVGRYRDAAAANVAAIAADRAYEGRVRPPASDYRRYLLRHNMQFAIVSALARGDGETALAVSEQYRTAYLGEGADPVSRLLGSAVHYSAGLHGDPAALAAAAEPADPLERLFHLYARGEAAARRADAAEVEAAAQSVAALRTGTDSPSLGRRGDQLGGIIEAQLAGRAAMMAGRPEQAAAAYRRAMQAQLDADFGSDPPLFWYSIRRSLAAALLAAGDAEGARNQLFASLRRWPNDPLALYALSLAERRLGDEASAERNLARAQAAWAGDVTQVTLARI
ncbi:hypothetical protein [Sphingosinicella terrae]|uniref:hypothetical protein n=1 Tax=Sphingosinicella terrae TaxID=2172047 RepID=UPI000E0D8887|nr:hypothetical protein [Sphingosinicella terrae]